MTSMSTVAMPAGCADMGSWMLLTSLVAMLAYSAGTPSGNTASSGTDGLRMNLEPPGMYGTAGGGLYERSSVGWW